MTSHNWLWWILTRSPPHILPSSRWPLIPNSQVNKSQGCLPPIFFPMTDPWDWYILPIFPWCLLNMYVYHRRILWLCFQPFSGWNLGIPSTTWGLVWPDPQGNPTTVHSPQFRYIYIYIYLQGYYRVGPQDHYKWSYGAPINGRK